MHRQWAVRVVGVLLALLVVSTGKAVSQGRRFDAAEVGEELRLGDGEIIEVRGTHFIFNKLIVEGTSTIKLVTGWFGYSEPTYFWLLDGGANVTGTLVIDGSGSNAGWTPQLGQAGRSITIALASPGDDSGLLERIAGGRGMVPGRLLIRSGGGAGTSAEFVPPGGDMFRLGIWGTDGGNGGNVRLQLVVGESLAATAEWEREIADGTLGRSWTQRLGVEVDVAGGNGVYGQRASGANGVDGGVEVALSAVRAGQDFDQQLLGMLAYAGALGAPLGRVSWRDSLLHGQCRSYGRSFASSCRTEANRGALVYERVVSYEDWNWNRGDLVVVCPTSDGTLSESLWRNGLGTTPMVRGAVRPEEWPVFPEGCEP